MSGASAKRDATTQVNEKASAVKKPHLLKFHHVSYRKAPLSYDRSHRAIAHATDVTQAIRRAYKSKKKKSL
jgi:hypothetical protein